MPPRSGARIVAQQGMFTVHGSTPGGIDELAASYPVLKLGAIHLDLSRTAHIIAALRRAGVNRLSIFPDLDSVAEHVSWFYQSTA
jgi:hypothetical protein